jgi:hypothetical protein
MKKLFVSVPMKGRTEEEIRASIIKMTKIAEAYEGEELELIDSYIDSMPPPSGYNRPIWYLGRSLEKLATADVFIGIDDYWYWNGCATESEVARRYGIKSYKVCPEYVIDGYNELLNKVINTTSYNAEVHKNYD